MKKIVIIGAGGHGRAVISTAMQLRQWDLHGVIDVNFHQQDEEILGVPVIGGMELLAALDCREISLAVAVGDNALRKELLEKALEKGFSLPNIVHPTACISINVDIGVGNYVGAMAHVGPCVNIGDGNIVNTFSNIEHEAMVGNYCHIAPSAVLCGRVVVGDQILIGANATVLDTRRVVDNVVVGSGAVITQSIVDPGATVVGVPGKVL